MALRRTTLLLLAFVVSSGLLMAQSEKKATPKDISQEPLVAKITLPWNNSMVRAIVPVFGFAGGKNFKAYRQTWIPISSGTKPYNQDPWSAGKVKWDPNRGASGTLGNWRTGLSSYRYGDWRENLLGEYSLRLVVEGKDGTTVEDRIHVVVAHVLTKVLGGEARSPDARFHLNVDKGSTTSNFVLVSMLPSNEPKLDPKLKVIGSSYEFRPPGVNFLKPGRLTAFYKDSELDAGSLAPDAQPGSARHKGRDGGDDRFNKIPGLHRTYGRPDPS
ncbi:MAG: hypothetical protein AMS16_00125 [Planctomycetes bacterium DG_58]|nr:MAG: hypothetical protein AMS16_00125 [Planctomycetes bacterium DG_58]